MDYIGLHNGDAYQFIVNGAGSVGPMLIMMN